MRDLCGFTPVVGGSYLYYIGSNARVKPVTWEQYPGALKTNSAMG